MPPSPASLGAAPHRTAPLAGRILAFAAVIASPLAVFAPLGLAPLVAIAAAAVVVGDWRRSLASVRPFAQVFSVLALLSLWGAVSAFWSPIPAHSLFESGRFLLINSAGLVICGAAATLAPAEARRLAYATAIGVLVAVVLLQLDLRDGGAFLRFVKDIPATQHVWAAQYDRGVTVLLLAAWPAGAGLTARRRWLGAAIVVVAVGLTVGEFSNRTAILAGLIALPAAAIGWRLPRIAAASMFGVVLCTATVAPLVAPNGASIEQIRLAAPMLPISAIHRLTIWRFTADRIADRPFLGWGMDASRALPGGKDRAIDHFPEVTLPETAEAMPLHPHDAPLQWRVELGVPGTALALAALGLVLVHLARERRGQSSQRAFTCGFAASTIVMALLSFGTWQAWWLSSLWLSAALLIGVNERQDPAMT